MCGVGFAYSIQDYSNHWKEKSWELTGRVFKSYSFFCGEVKGFFLCPMPNFPQKDEILIMSDVLHHLPKYWDAAAMDVSLLRNSFCCLSIFFHDMQVRFAFSLLLFFPALCGYWKFVNCNLLLLKAFLKIYWQRLIKVEFR